MAVSDDVRLQIKAAESAIGQGGMTPTVTSALNEIVTALKIVADALDECAEAAKVTGNGK